MRIQISVTIMIFALLYASCAIIPPAKLPEKERVKTILVEDFENMFLGDSVDPSGTEELFLKGSKYPADGWVVAQGPKDAKLWRVSVSDDGYNSKRAVLLEWDNRNEVYLTFGIWFWEVPEFKDGEEIRFYVKAFTRVKFDVTIRINADDGSQIAFTTMSPIIEASPEWQKIVVPFYKMSVPDWFIKEEMGGKEPSIKSVPANPKIAMIDIAPVWNSTGKCLIDNIEIGSLTKERKKIEERKKKDWFDSTSFVCYYGSDAMAEMSDFDIAIIESRSHKKEDIEMLKKAGVWTVGYVTIGEDDQLNKGDGKGPGGYASYYMDADWDGKPDMNVNWNSYYVNAGSPLWQDIIINKRVKEVIEKGCDGIFMDTVDTVDIYPETKQGMIDLIRKIREKYPEIKIVQNRGFGVLEETAEYIDAIMYEDFSIDYDWQTDTYSKADQAKLVSTGLFAKGINELRKKKNFLVLALDYADLNQKDLIQFCYDRAWEYDFIPYVSRIQLDEVYPRFEPKSERGSKKFKGETGVAAIEGKPGRIKEVINKISAKKDPNNLALYYNGAKVKADSIFVGEYDPIKVIDGLTNDKNLPWEDAAWASLELPVEHWIEIELAKTAKIKRVKIYWAFDNGKYFNSQEVEVQYYFQGYWKKLGVIKTDKMDTPVSEIIIEKPEIGKTLRIYQSAGKGPKVRPNLMWIAEVEVYSE